MARNNPISNPFGADNDDDDNNNGGGYNNPFAKPKKKKKKKASASNPFGDDEKKQQPPMEKAKPRSSVGSNPNPFGDDDDDDDNKNKGISAFTKKSTKTMTQRPTSASTGSIKNPFGDDDDDDNNTNTSNPFGEPTTTKANGKASPSKQQHTRMQTAPVFNTPIDPFESKAGGIGGGTKPQKANHTKSQTIGGGGGVGDGTNNNNNPFDFDTDFDEDTTKKKQQTKATPVKKSFFRGGGGGGGTKNNNNSKDTNGGYKKKDSALEPIASKMDSEGDVVDNSTKELPIPMPLITKTPLKGGNNRRPSLLSKRSQSENTTNSRNKFNNNKSIAESGGGGGGGGESSLANWLRGNKSADELESDTPNNMHTSSAVGNGVTPIDTKIPTSKGGGGGGGARAKKKSNAKSTGVGSAGAGDAGMKKDDQLQKRRQDKRKERKGSTVGKQILIQCWPYDDYHKEQEKYYRALHGREKAKANSMMGGGGGGASRQKKGFADYNGYYSGSDDEKRVDSRNNNNGDEFDNPNKFFERPGELPGIKEAVQNLSLLEFETKAEERAISIVSTWLFDTGLIDELLINGGNGRSARSNLNSSTLSAEGIEVGAHGFPIEGGLKVDNEIEKLRASVQRDLTLVNTRLNDGVAASGSEVKDLVSAVSATKEDLGRLRELTTYISSGATQQQQNGEASTPSMRHGALFSDFPRLKRAINARRNIFRCFRELEFFAQISTTCERLREELYEGDYTDDEWNKIRDVCMEHVELEIILVEAEAGMKAWLDDEEGEMDDDASFRSLRSNKSLIKSWRNKQSAIASHYEVVDKFLSEHVKNVWELGEEINIKILSGIGNAFDISLKNPGGMVALVEAVEVYERAASQYKKVRATDDGLSSRNRLHFTDMRASALERLYTDFEMRGFDVFRAIHMQAADLAMEEDAQKSQFNAVLRGATELVAEIDIVKNQMAPCFAPHWHVEMLWSSCVAHVCSNNIIQQIGGPDGQNLPELTVTQLLDLVAWVEFFRQTIEDAFPNVAMKKEKKTYFDERPDLFIGDKKKVNVENATDSLAWVNNMLWEVHRLAQDEFLLRTRSQTDDLLSNVYSADHETHQTSEGRLMTSLCEDIFSLATIQLRTIRERLTRKSEALVMAVCLIFSQLRAKQLSTRDIFLKDLESCCAAANDFQRMAEQSEDLLQELLENCDLPDESVSVLEESCETLVSLYSGDAVFAAQRAHAYIFDEIEKGIAADLFGPQWEKDLTNSELARKLTSTLEDFILDLETWLDEFMLKKTVDALVTATIVFYVKFLLIKAETHTNNRVSFFSDTSLACERVFRDAKVISDYFKGLAEGMPSLKKHIDKEFDILITVNELMRIAAGLTESDSSDFIFVLHKRIRDVNITKHVVGDLWHLVQPTEERAVWELTESLEDTLNAICPTDGERARNDRMNVPGLRLDETLGKLYIKTKRKRPVVAGNIEKMATALRNNWKTEEQG